MGDVADVDCALHDVRYGALSGFHDGADVFECLGGFLGHCAFDDVSGTVDGQLPGNEKQAADSHGLRVVASGLGCGRCFDGFRHTNWPAKVNPKSNSHTWTATL